jgi:glyoxylase-like metal-dependent hydrolase (beta-lactamase superfamily II)
VNVGELAPGLWRWTAPHPEWRPTDRWPQEVGCVYYEAPAAVVLIDPLVPDGEEERFWRALDCDVARVARPVAVLLTAPWHERSAATVVARYAAARWEPSAAPLPEGVVAAPAGGTEEGEVAFFLPSVHALVTGDVVVGSAAGLDVISSAAPGDVELLASLERMAALEPELVVPSHGEPVLGGGAAALRGALERHNARTL